MKTSTAISVQAVVVPLAAIALATVVSVAAIAALSLAGANLGLEGSLILLGALFLGIALPGLAAMALIVGQLNRGIGDSRRFVLLVAGLLGVAQVGDIASIVLAIVRAGADPVIWIVAASCLLLTSAGALWLGYRLGARLAIRVAAEPVEFPAGPVPPLRASAGARRAPRLMLVIVAIAAAVGVAIMVIAVALAPANSARPFLLGLIGSVVMVMLATSLVVAQVIALCYLFPLSKQVKVLFGESFGAQMLVAGVVLRRRPDTLDATETAVAVRYAELWRLMIPITLASLTTALGMLLCNAIFQTFFGSSVFGAIGQSSPGLMVLVATFALVIAGVVTLAAVGFNGQIRAAREYLAAHASA